MVSYRTVFHKPRNVISLGFAQLDALLLPPVWRPFNSDNWGWRS